MKIEFELDTQGPLTNRGNIAIVGLRPNYRPYVSVRLIGNNELELSACVKDKDLERFAVNILKALKSKRLKV